MRALALIPALALAGCVTSGQIGQVGDTVASVCAKENYAHAGYLIFIAPFRPAEKVEKAKAFHARVQTACEIGGLTLAELRKQVAAAEAARSEK